MGPSRERPALLLRAVLQSRSRDLAALVGTAFDLSAAAAEDTCEGGVASVVAA